jgi:DDE superfamily endonuclease/Helix-turn-helix of DDE superfamily endonuclease
MDNKYTFLSKTPKNCKRLFGLSFDKLELLIEKVQNYIKEELAKNPLSRRGLNSELGEKDQILLSLEYLRNYVTYAKLGFDYGISESWACKIYHYHLPIFLLVIGLKNPQKISKKKVRKLLIDVACQPVERPQENQEMNYNGQKKRHIIKAQVMVNQDFSKKHRRPPFQHCQVETIGRKADITVFKETELEIDEQIKLKADLGYQGIEKLHKNSQIPHKKPKEGSLTKAQKKANKKLRRKRVQVEHAIRLAKVWRIVKETYRNKLRKIKEVWLVICGLVNFEFS